MENVEALQKKIDIKFKTLNLVEKETSRVLGRRKIKELEKHLQNLENKLEEIQELKYKKQEKMVEEEKDTMEIEKWSRDLDEQVARFDEPMEMIQIVIKEVKEAQDDDVRREQEHEEERRMERRLEEERRVTEMKLELKKKYEDKREDQSKKLPADSTTKVKLPKLVITKFEGTHFDWFRFWNQFENEIDKSELNSVSKLSYLKELLAPKVRLLIDGLPFNTEGYQRAKAILTSKYGKPSEVANAHIQAIMSLPVINNSNPVRIHEFYEKLLTSVQCLETMGKLTEIKGYVRLTLEKLPGIRSDLVRIDDEWQEWNFGQLVDALRKWTERNPILENKSSDRQRKEEKLLQVKQNKPNECIYCEKTGHRAADCKNVTSVSERRKILSRKKLCFNCTGVKHRAAECS